MKKITDMFSDIGSLNIEKSKNIFRLVRLNKLNQKEEFEVIPFYLYYALKIYSRRFKK